MDLSRLLASLTAVLGLSLLVERFLELFKNIIEPFLGRSKDRAGPPPGATESKIAAVARTYAIDSQVVIDKAGNADYESGIKALETAAKAAGSDGQRLELEARARDLYASSEVKEAYPISKVLVVPATDPDDGTTFRAFMLQALGFAAGIIVSRCSGVGLFGQIFDQNIPNWLDFVLTGLLIGGGSAPIHVLIRFVTERKALYDALNKNSGSTDSPSPSETASTGSASSASSPVVHLAADPALAEWEDVPYDGGVDKELLEDIQRRKGIIDTVIYHHTAMRSTSSFGDVVKVIKDRTDPDGKHWLTGYNCVILADGSIHAFCRWDRYGSHAGAWNPRSLGLAFNGNFETDPNIPYSNPNGAYGPSRPTEAQLRAGARVVALWSFLYPAIWPDKKQDPDFVDRIMPHSKVSPDGKTCPGTSFPKKEFQEWIVHYGELWDGSPAVTAKIAAFKLKPYLFWQGGSHG
jgi:hypothetical protein